jgi:peroxiredoxin
LGLAVLAAIVGGLVAFDRWVYSDDLGPLDTRSPEIGELAPAFALRDPEGNIRQLSDYRGRVVWINFWATWCGPCRRELPEIQRLADEFRDEGLVVLAVNFQESAGTAVSFWEELDLDLPILLDSSGEVAEQYRTRNLPNNFFIDRDGVLRALRMGFLTEGEMREKLAEVGLQAPVLLDVQ